MLRTETRNQVSMQFLQDVALHTMRIHLDQGHYRHLRFKNPARGNYWFDLIAWPGHLAITGDMGTFVFSREYDMLAFFNEPHVSPDYWAQKLVSSQDAAQQYSREIFWTLVNERLEELKEDRTYEDIVQSVMRESQYGWNLDDENDAQKMLEYVDSTFSEPVFQNAREWDLREYTYQYLWACHAIRWGAKKYFEDKRLRRMKRARNLWTWLCGRRRDGH